MIDSFYNNVKGVGTCIGGTMLQGKVHKNQIMYLGPDSNGHFFPLIVKGVHENRVECDYAEAGQSVCFAIKQAPGKKEALK